MGCCFWHTSFSNFKPPRPRRLWLRSTRGSEKCCRRVVISCNCNLKNFKHRRRQWLHTPVFFPGEFHAQRNLAGYSPCVAKSRTRQQLTHTHRTLGFLGGSHGQESVCNPADLGSTPGSGRSHGEGNGYPLQYSCLENSMDRGGWRATVQRMARSQNGAANTFALGGEKSTLSNACDI